MDDIGEVWEWVKKIAGVVFVVCSCLYVIRCCSTTSILSVDQFDHYIRELIKKIWA